MGPLDLKHLKWRGLMITSIQKKKIVFFLSVNVSSIKEEKVANREKIRKLSSFY